MSIAAANLWTRNIYKAFLKPDATVAEEAKQAKLTSLIVKIFALAFIVFLPTQYAINLQLLGGVWILQTFPAVVVGLYTRWFHNVALLVGWLVAMLLGTALALAQGLKATFPIHLGAFNALAYIAVEAVAINFLVAAILTPILDRAGVARRDDVTSAADYVDPPLVVHPLSTLGTAGEV